MKGLGLLSLIVRGNLLFPLDITQHYEWRTVKCLDEVTIVIHFEFSAFFSSRLIS